jgi:hypothetical protein
MEPWFGDARGQEISTNLVYYPGLPCNKVITKFSGIGGFAVRTRIVRPKDEESLWDTISGSTFTLSLETNLSITPPAVSVAPALLSTPCAILEDKPKRKQNRKKPKNKLAEHYPIYLQASHIILTCIPEFIHNNVHDFLQDAFFGREILDGSKEQKLLTALDLDDDKAAPNVALSGIQLNQVNLFQIFLIILIH